MTTAPTELAYGYVDGRLILVIGDSSDTGRMPDPVPAAGTTVQITPKQPIIRVAGADPTTVVKQSITCTLDEDGRLLDPAGARGVWLVTGVYTVTYKSSTAAIPTHDIEVTAAHTEGAPLDLTLAMPPGGPVLTPSQYAELSARIDGIVVEAAGVSSVNGATGAVVLDAEDVGALPSSYTPPAQTWADVMEKPETFPSTAHAASHATGGSDPITPESIGAATSAQGAKADSAVQPDDVADVIREGDARLTDARTPTSHTHAYEDITDPPTIPGPQTLSLDGPDLSLSGGGGTVTLPAGGGGGGGAPVQTLPDVGVYFLSPWVTSTIDKPISAVPYPAVVPVPAPLTIDTISVQVHTAQAGATGAVEVYALTPTLTLGALITTLTGGDFSTTGRKDFAWTHQVTGPGLAIKVTSSVTSVRVMSGWVVGPGAGVGNASPTQTMPAAPGEYPGALGGTRAQSFAPLVMLRRSA